MTLINSSHRAYAGTLIARMHVDLGSPREITRSAFALGGEETKTWSFSYNVGPESYGRGLEVRFVDTDGGVVDTCRNTLA